TGGVFDRLAVVRCLPFAVEIALSYHVCGKIERACDAVKHIFNHEHALWSAKATERGLRSLIRAADVAGGFQGRAKVSVIAMKQRACQNRLRQIQAPSAVGIERELQSLDSTVIVKTSGKPGKKRMTLAGESHVKKTRQPHAHRTPGLPCSQASDRRVR